MKYYSQFNVPILHLSGVSSIRSFPVIISNLENLECEQAFDFVQNRFDLAHISVRKRHEFGRSFGLGNGGRVDGVGPDVRRSKDVLRKK